MEIKRMVCLNCKWYEPSRHECRYNPPSVYFVNYGNSEDCGAGNAWPMVYEEDWCGKFSCKVD